MKKQVRKLLPIIVFTAVGLLVIYVVFGPDDSLPLYHIEDAFLDIDGDGDPDYILEAEVVFNGSTTFTLPAEEPAPIPEPATEDAAERVAVFTLFGQIDSPTMSSGELFSEWEGKAAGCPDDMEYWTTITLPGGEVFTCLHHAGMPYYKTLSNGELYVQLLIDSLPVPLGTRVNVDVAYQ